MTSLQVSPEKNNSLLENGNKDFRNLEGCTLLQPFLLEKEERDLEVKDLKDQLEVRDIHIASLQYQLQVQRKLYEQELLLMKYESQQREKEQDERIKQLETQLGDFHWLFENLTKDRIPLPQRD